MVEISYSDLEISLSGLRGNRYRVQVRYWPASDDDALQPAATGEARLDPDEFGAVAAEDYGRRLAERLFEAQPVRERFLLARQDTYARAENPGGLRIRLWFEPGTEQLHSLRWETLCSPPRMYQWSTLLRSPLKTWSCSPASWAAGAIAVYGSGPGESSAYWY